MTNTTKTMRTSTTRSPNPVVRAWHSSQLLSAIFCSEEHTLFLIELAQRIAANRYQGNGSFMPEGHNSPQQGVSTGTDTSRAEPRPRRSLKAKAPQTASERFLARFGAAPNPAAPSQPTPRAMNNPTPASRQLPLIELQGDLFLVDSAHYCAAPSTTGPAYGISETAAIHAPAAGTRAAQSAQHQDTARTGGHR